MRRVFSHRGRVTVVTVRGPAQGLHGGIGADIFSGSLMWNVDTRLLWLQRHSGESEFALQVGLGLSPKLQHPTPSGHPSH